MIIDSLPRQVLSIDDDVIVPCGEVAAAFAAWQRTADQLVGWFPRGVALSPDCHARYLLRDAAVLLRGHYSMVLTKVCGCCACRCSLLLPTLLLLLQGSQRTLEWKFRSPPEPLGAKTAGAVHACSCVHHLQRWFCCTHFLM